MLDSLISGEIPSSELAVKPLSAVTEQDSVLLEERPRGPGRPSTACEPGLRHAEWDAGQSW